VLLVAKDVLPDVALMTAEAFSILLIEGLAVAFVALDMLCGA
jgi:hypothetical protein